MSDSVLAMLMQVVAEPLSREGAAAPGRAQARAGRERTEDDVKFIELVLHLFKNLLVVPDASKKEASGGDNLSHMHDDLIVAFSQENVLEMLLLMAQDLREQRYNHWGVLVMEMLSCILRHKTADSILASLNPAAKAATAVSQPAEPGGLKFDPCDPLYSLLCKDKQHRHESQRNASSRHNRFYGSFRSRIAKGKPHRGFRRGLKELPPGALASLFWARAGRRSCPTTQGPEEAAPGATGPADVWRGGRASGRG